jgi:hypothetical protein
MLNQLLIKFCFRDKEITNLVTSYMGAQNLTAVQLLLEVCNGNREKEPNLEEIRNIACEQIHQMFVADSALPKLVHFNVSCQIKFSYLIMHFRCTRSI